LEQYLRRLTPADMRLKWRVFLEDGFEDWRGLATVAAYQTTEPDPAVTLQGMIARFLVPEDEPKSAEYFNDALEGLAIAYNAKFRDPKTGKILGKTRDVKIKQQQAKKGTIGPGPQSGKLSR